jgi:hypothetical protein
MLDILLSALNLRWDRRTCGVGTDAVGVDGTSARSFSINISHSSSVKERGTWNTWGEFKDTGASWTSRTTDSSALSVLSAVISFGNKYDTLVKGRNVVAPTTSLLVLQMTVQILSLPGLAGCINCLSAGYGGILIPANAALDSTSANYPYKAHAFSR